MSIYIKQNTTFKLEDKSSYNYSWRDIESAEKRQMSESNQLDMKGARWNRPTKQTD